MKKVAILLYIITMTLYAKNYSTNTEVVKLIKHLEKRYNGKTHYLTNLFSNIQVQQSALKLFRPKVKKRRTAEEIEILKKLYPKYGAWDRYSKYKLSDSRINNGIQFLEKHLKILTEVEESYGVPKEYITAIIGIESAYGKNVGKYPILDTLTTLAFEKNRRNKFFKKQLIKFIELSLDQKFNPRDVYGSYAGAIGLCQFMPSNYNAYGIDFNGDGKITLQQEGDAIASIANYFIKNGWRKGELVATRVGYRGMRFNKFKTGYKRTYNRIDLVGIAPKQRWNYHNKVRLIKLNRTNYDELWYGTKNFFVITRYNHSAYYAMAVHQLAVKIKKGFSEN